MNLLLNAKKFRARGLTDKETDLKLVERYQEKVPLAEGFELRRWFLSLWDDAKHSRNMGWYDEAWLTSKVNQFNEIYAHR